MQLPELAGRQPQIRPEPLRTGWQGRKGHDRTGLRPPISVLQDPEAGNEATGELLARQFGLLRTCLEDPAPAVRAGAVQGTCVLLHRFWELIPAGTSAAFLIRLAGKDTPASHWRLHGATPDFWRAVLQLHSDSAVLVPFAAC